MTAPAAAPRKRSKAKDRGRCGVCVTRILPGERTVTEAGLGKCHEECVDELDRGAREGGCDRDTYLRIFTAVAHPED